MKKTFTLFIIVFISHYLSASSESILVNESTIILDFQQTKELFFSFAEGDQITISLEMVKGKHIKEVEIIELPSNSIFSDFKVRELNEKQVSIRNKGIYKFRFFSSSLTRRVCKIKIHRIPGPESTKDFNTNWKWEVQKDTTYIPYTIDSITGYDIVKYIERRRELVASKKEEELIMNRSERVHSQTNLDNSNSTSVRVDLPYLTSTDLREEKIIAWAYWIGVGEEANEAYTRNVDAITTLAKGVASFYTSPIGGVAVGAISELLLPNIGEDVSFWFIPNYENVVLFESGQRFSVFNQGKGIAAYGKNTNLNSGTFYIGLNNDNFSLGINVNIKIVVIKEIKVYENKEYQKERKDPIKITLNKKRMQVNTTKIRVPVE
ncbi:hypothetical protein [Kordia jejudonensis]|uniref:hypothetical protein n=1 Tax=Kordia jejudonensis TaxID=1348245 RepID=UPI0006298D11|nr:hypothetical protein [Kordia jejudonensis]